MDPLASAVDKLKGFAKSTQDFLGSIIHPSQDANRRKPIEILKRLQREAFSDLMKLRDRQDKVERLLSFHKSSKGSQFQDTSTLMTGEIDAVGALLMINDVEQQTCDAVKRAGIRTGITSKFTFETAIRQRDIFQAEFVTDGENQVDDLHSPLSLGKLLYAANISDWCSAVAIPFGARCKDLGFATDSSCQKNGLTEYSLCKPSLLNQHLGSGIGLMVRKSNVVASLAQFVSGPGSQSGSTEIMHCFRTIGQVVCQLSSNSKLSILGMHQIDKFSGQQVRLGAMAMPIRILKHCNGPGTSEEASGLLIGKNENDVSAGSIALMFESEFDEFSRIGGWVEMKRSSHKYLKWGVTVSDTPDDDYGWGLSLGGLAKGPTTWEHFQIEAFMKFNVGKKFRLQPALVYVMDDTVKFPALMLRSSWSL